MKLEKGGIVHVDGWWYIIVNIRLKDGKVTLDCLCDNANNIYNHSIENVKYAASLREIHQSSFGSGLSDKFYDLIQDRPIPYSVIVEVLSGGEDNRFEHWYQEEE